MKFILFSVILLGLTFCASAQISTNQPAQFKFKIAAYEGKTNSGTCGKNICPNPEIIYPGNGGGDTITSVGHESELKWSFVGRNGNRDVYHFTFKRMAKAGSSGTTTSAKDVQFNGKQTIVFEDELHTVVMDSPSEADLEPAQKH